MSVVDPRFASYLLLIFLVVQPNIVQAEETKPNIEADHSEKMKAGLVVFKDRVRTILIDKCVECHGGKSTKADFDLSTRKALLDSGYVGKTADDSYLMELIRHTAEPHMPFKAPKLSETEIAHIAKWLDLGAPFDKPLIDSQSTPASRSSMVYHGFCAGARRRSLFRRSPATAACLPLCRADTAPHV